MYFLATFYTLSILLASSLPASYTVETIAINCTVLTMFNTIVGAAAIGRWLTITQKLQSRKVKRQASHIHVAKLQSQFLQVFMYLQYIPLHPLPSSSHRTIVSVAVFIQ